MDLIAINHLKLYSSESDNEREAIEEALRHGKKLDWLNLPFVNLYGAKIKKISLIDACIPGANFVGADLEEAALTRAMLNASKLMRANFYKGRAIFAAFHHSELSQIRAEKSDFSRSDLSSSLVLNANFNDSVLESISATNSVFNGSELRFCKCKGASFSRASLREVDFTGADLSYVNFSNSDLRGSIFTDAKTIGANFLGANLNKAVGLNSAAITPLEILRDQNDPIRMYVGDIHGVLAAGMTYGAPSEDELKEQMIKKLDEENERKRQDVENQINKAMQKASADKKKELAEWKEKYLSAQLQEAEEQKKNLEPPPGVAVFTRDKLLSDGIDYKNIFRVEFNRSDLIEIPLGSVNTAFVRRFAVIQAINPS